MTELFYRKDSNLCAIYKNDKHKHERISLESEYTGAIVDTKGNSVPTQQARMDEQYLRQVLSTSPMESRYSHWQSFDIRRW